MSHDARSDGMSRHQIHTLVAAILAVPTVGYTIPWVIAGARATPNVGLIALINVLLGWTIVGWIVALIMAIRTPRPVPG